MTTYTVTTSNWNSPAFWSGINQGASGHVLDFSALPSTYSIDFDSVTGDLTISGGKNGFRAPVLEHARDVQSHPRIKRHNDPNPMTRDLSRKAH